MFRMKNKENSFPVRTLISRSVIVLVNQPVGQNIVHACVKVCASCYTTKYLKSLQSNCMTFTQPLSSAVLVCCTSVIFSMLNVFLIALL